MEKFNAEIQVNTEHYKLGNEVFFLNAYNQVNDVLFLIKKNNILNPRILIIGVGDNLVSIILKHKFDYHIKTLDIDKNLSPDFVGSINELDSIVKEKFDIVICAHVLEHLPHEYFHQLLEKINFVADYALIYLPIAQFGMCFNFGIFPIFSKRINFLVSWFFKKHKFDGQHYWEIGTSGYPLSFIQKEIEECFKIQKKYNAENWMYSYNFVLKSRK